MRMRTCIAVQKLIRLKVRPKKKKKNYARASEVNGFPNHANWVMVEDLDPLIHIMAERSNDISDSGRFVQNVYQKFIVKLRAERFLSRVNRLRRS